MCGVNRLDPLTDGIDPVATASATLQSQVFLLASGMPRPAQRTADPAEPQMVFDALLSGPTPEERARGLTTELTGVKQIAVHDLDGRALLVETIPSALKVPPPAFAQIYCTGLLLSGQTVLKISYLDSGATPYSPPTVRARGRSRPPPPPGAERPGERRPHVRLAGVAGGGRSTTRANAASLAGCPTY
jgi:hypothetical protein